MKTIEMLRANPAASEDALRILEHTFGAELPADYRAWLQECNGGWPDNLNNWIDDSAIPGVPNCIGVQDFLSTDRIISTHREYGGRIPRYLLPIGDDGDGNYVCLGILGESRGGIYYWDHENEPAAFELLEEKLSSEHTNIHFIAKSFSDFAEKLGPSPYR
ncbi:MAG: SMI1/KNR4 family protein [Candidatus Methylacidiphilales bacterium]|nr:SMI1/KNR4 family protein [Candidatus Methylacidiphilales bacterium]